jgi:hypothetical protein
LPLLHTRRDCAALFVEREDGLGNGRYASAGEAGVEGCGVFADLADVMHGLATYAALPRQPQAGMPRCSLSAVPIARLARSAGSYAEKTVYGAGAKQAGQQRDYPDKTPNGLGPNEHQRKKRRAHDDPQDAIPSSDVG